MAQVPPNRLGPGMSMNNPFGCATGTIAATIGGAAAGSVLGPVAGGIGAATGGAGALTSLPGCDSSSNGTLILTPSPAPGPDMHWEGTPN